MALINCSECQKQISDKAVSCPNCGCPMDKNVKNIVFFRKHKRKIKYSFMIFVVILISTVLFHLYAYYRPLNEYENYTLQAIQTLKDSLKNMDSLQIHDITYVSGSDKHRCIANVSAQNGYGGMTSDSILFIEDKQYFLSDITDPQKITQMGFTQNDFDDYHTLLTDSENVENSIEIDKKMVIRRLK